MSLPPYCDRCGGNRGFRSVDGICRHCIEDDLRAGPKKRITKAEFQPDNPEHFKLRTRQGGFRYYRVLAA